MIYTNCCYLSYLSAIKEAKNKEDYLYIYNIAKVNQFNRLKIIGKKVCFIKLMISIFPKTFFQFLIKKLNYIINL